MRTSEKDYPGTVQELVDECKSLIQRYDLYKLGEPKTEEEKRDWPSWPDGTEIAAGEYLYGVAYVPAQWVTHVLERIA